MVDFGYDISNFYDIQPEYGTMKDLEELISKAKSLGLKLILDFVPNHSSDECEWFKKSAERDPDYDDYYIWHPGKPNPDGGRNLPPTNWVSVFYGSAWTYHPVRQEYYLHQFTKQQPDFNYRSEKLRNQMKDVLRFWLDKGVDGFRVDAIPHLVEGQDSNGEFVDEPVVGQDPLDYGYTLKTQTKDHPMTYTMVYEWREVLDQHQKEHGGDTRVMMTEAYTDVDHTMEYFGNGSQIGAHIPFNFFLISDLKLESNARDFKTSIDKWLDNLPSGKTSNWVLGNHDQKRLASRLGEERLDGINMMLKLLPGASVTYQGEELGLTDVFLTWEQTKDPQACNAGKDHYLEKSRDPARTPMQWDATVSSGFSTSENTWLPLAPDYKDNNLEKQKASTKSHYKVYKALSPLRQLEVVKYGSYDLKVLNENVLAFTRNLYGYNSIVVVLNFGPKPENVPLRSYFANLSERSKVKLSSINSERNIGDTVMTEDVALSSYEALVLEDWPIY
ncbi:maltase A1-like [Ctenocephalides felis]|uniref:maltase A1-like n=1 Tax=Ctenocephalides felis TaxID=7515 RepID=UPI000E6E487C|nr:maltase A1-like [Ctenocephalides felis]